MTIKNGQEVSVHYVGTLNDGTVFDSSRDRGQPLKFKVGDNKILPAFEEMLSEMTEGDKKSFSLTPSQAYGEVQENLIQTYPHSSFPTDFKPVVGEMIKGTNPNNGNALIATILSENSEGVLLDFNHPLAGKDINFEIELLEVKDDN
mgnify:CR=1 FL=1